MKQIVISIVALFALGTVAALFMDRGQAIEPVVLSDITYLPVGMPVGDGESDATVTATTAAESVSTLKVTYACTDGKSITAYFAADDNSVRVDVSDGRSLPLVRAISASGARYANEDETFVFWNKGNTAFILEGPESEMTYADCAV